MKKKLKKPSFSKKEFNNLFPFFSNFLMNYALSRTHESDLSYRTLFRLGALLQLLEDEILFLNEQEWVKNSIRKIKK